MGEQLRRKLGRADGLGPLLAALGVVAKRKWRMPAAPVSAPSFSPLSSRKRSSGRYMPLFGLNLFAARAIFKDPMVMIYRSVLSFVVVNFAALVLTCLPAMLLPGSAH